MAITFNNGGVYSVALEGVFNSDTQIRNVFHWELLDGGSLTQEQGLDDLIDIMTAIVNIIKTVNVALMVWERIRVQNLEGAPWALLESFPSPIAGTETGDPDVRQTAILGYGGTEDRRRQLRKYIGAIGQISISSQGNIRSEPLADLAPLGALLMTPQEATNGIWLYGHYRTGVPGSFVYPLSWTWSNNPSTQRRRRRGRGI